MITLKTTLGDIVIELDYDKAPNTAKNFEDYVKSAKWVLENFGELFRWAGWREGTAGGVLQGRDPARKLSGPESSKGRLEIWKWRNRQS